MNTDTILKFMRAISERELLNALSEGYVYWENNCNKWDHDELVEILVGSILDIAPSFAQNTAKRIEPYINGRKEETYTDNFSTENRGIVRLMHSISYWLKKEKDSNEQKGEKLETKQISEIIEDCIRICGYDDIDYEYNDICKVIDYKHATL